LHFQISNYQKAIDMWKKNNPCGINDAQIGAAYVLYRKEFDESEKYISQAMIHTFMAQLDVSMSYANLYEARKEYQKVIDISEWMLASIRALKYPNVNNLLMKLEGLYLAVCGEMYLYLNDVKKAKDYLFNLINKYPQSYVGHKTLAELYEKEEKNSNAVDEYIRLTEIKNDNLNINYKIATLLNKEKRNEEAITILQDILKKKPELYKATQLLGNILHTEERYKEAISVYMNALRYNPGNYDLYYNLGMSYTMINDFQRAKEFYEKAAEINSLLYHAKLSLGQIAIIYGDLDEAEKYFNESLKGKELEGGSYYYLSQVAMLKGDKEKATNYMNIAVKLEPKIYDKVQKDTVFMPIKQEIEEPTPEEKENNRSENIPPQERKAINHLSKICALVSSLNNDDLKIMKNIKERQKDKYHDKQRESS